MKEKIVFSIAATLILVINSLAAVPIVDPGVKLQSGGTDISVTPAGKGYAAPEVVDWNNDGLNDLLVGQYEDGKIRLYLNTGTEKAPAFDGFSYLQSNGSDIKLTSQ